MRQEAVLLILKKEAIRFLDSFFFISLNTVPATEDIAPFAIGLAKNEEIKSLYEIGKYYSLNHMYLKMSTLMYLSICMHLIKLLLKEFNKYVSNKSIFGNVESNRLILIYICVYAFCCKFVYKFVHL